MEGKGRVKRRGGKGRKGVGRSLGEEKGSREERSKKGKEGERV